MSNDHFCCGPKFLYLRSTCIKYLCDAFLPCSFSPIIPQIGMCIISDVTSFLLNRVLGFKYRVSSSRKSGNSRGLSSPALKLLCYITWVNLLEQILHIYHVRLYQSANAETMSTSSANSLTLNIQKLTRHP